MWMTAARLFNSFVLGGTDAPAKNAGASGRSAFLRFLVDSVHTLATLGRTQESDVLCLATLVLGRDFTWRLYQAESTRACIDGGLASPNPEVVLLHRNLPLACLYASM